MEHLDYLSLHHSLFSGAKVQPSEFNSTSVDPKLHTTDATGFQEANTGKTTSNQPLIKHYKGRVSSAFVELSNISGHERLHWKLCSPFQPTNSWIGPEAASGSQAVAHRISTERLASFGSYEGRKGNQYISGTVLFDSTNKIINGIVIRSCSIGQHQNSRDFFFLFSSSAKLWNYPFLLFIKTPWFPHMSRTCFWLLRNLRSPNCNSEAPHKGLRSFSVLPLLLHWQS